MTKKLLIIAIIVVLIIVILLFLFGQRKSPVINSQLPITNNSITNQPNINQEPVGQKELTLAEKAEIERQGVMVKARNFIERYGSFSTDANFANLYELKDEMTDRFWQITEADISKAKKALSSEALAKEDFYSISAKVLNIIEKSFSDSLATYSVSTQRKETKNQIEKILYQSAEIKMVKEQGSWKTDSVKWQ